MSQSWKKTLIGPENSIKDALKILDKWALRVVLIVDDKQRLLGVITDGDIRRGILSGLSIEESVVKVMNKNPTVANANTEKKELIALMKSLDILFIPLVEKDKVVGLQTLHTSTLNKKKDNPIFIVAGGFGKRLKPLTNDCPKPMLKVGELSILEILINQFIQYGFYRFYISIHYLPFVIKDYFGDGSRFGAEITYIHEEVPLGTGGALGLLPQDMPELPLIMINGDILTKVDFDKLLEFHMQHDIAATMCVREHEYQVPFGVVESDGIYIDSMVEKPVHRYFINAGVYVVNPQLYRRVDKHSYCDMPDLLEASIESGGKVIQFPIHEYWLDIGRLDDFHRAQLDINTLGNSCD